VFLRSIAPGLSLERALEDAVKDAIEKLPIPKVMSYQLADGASTVKFVRPAHGLVALHGPRVVGISVLGLEAGRITHGHRFQGERDLSLDVADAYEALLETRGRVIADFDKRRADIARQLQEKALSLSASLGAADAVAPLLDEVTALVEFPAVYVGEFEPEYLGVPQECLILTMRQNQKYFPLFDAAGKLTNKFLIVSNMRLTDPKNIVAGNQRVVRPRLADARFFFETDKKTRLADRVPRLANVVYHNKLGSQLDRLERVQRLAAALARTLGFEEEHASRAARLAKADLLTNMVGEFPELQGIMGQYYARHDGESPEVCSAIEEHYRPRFSGDALPSTNAGVLVALADKMEAIAGMFGIGQQPTGDKDPFALRRQALGVLRILIEKKLPLNLAPFLRNEVANQFHGITAFSDPTNEVLAFLTERLRGYLREKNYSPNEIEAVVSITIDRVDQVIPRLDAVRAFSALTEAQSLASANKRIGNILKKADSGASRVSVELLSEPAEKALASSIEKIRPDVQKHVANGDYTNALTLLAQTKEPVDAFFNDVMVMVEHLPVRNNRIALLRELHGLMNQVADISRLAA
jgi:glycyl-tRNA synthetase beta chain